MSDRAIRIMVVEDDPGGANLIEECLRELCHTSDLFIRVHSVRQVEDYLRGGGSADLILLDLSLPDSNGIETLRRTLAVAPDVAVVVLAGSADERLLLEALRVGVGDYLVKDALSRRALVPALSHVIERAGRERAHRELEAALRESERRFRLALRNSPVIVSSVDRELRYTWVYNPHSSFDAEACLGKRDDELSPPEHTSELVALKREVLESGSAKRREVRVRVGTELRFYDVSAEPLRDEFGEANGLTVAATDITDCKRREGQKELLAHAGAVLSSSLDSAEMLHMVARLLVPELSDWCVIDVMTEDGTLDHYHVAAADPRKEMLLRKMLDLHPHEAASPSHPVSAVLRDRRSLLLEEVTPELLAGAAQSEAHGEIISELAPVSSMIVPMVTRGRLLGAITLTAAESGRRFNREDLALAEELGRRAALALQNARLYERERSAVRTRDEVLSIVAHDLRNPLSAIGLYAHMLSESLKVGEREREGARAIGRLCEQADRLIRDLLDVGRIEAGELMVDCRPVPLGGLITPSVEVLRVAAERKPIALEVEIESGERLVSADPDRIAQVLSNLIGNALKFTRSGGRIVVRARPHGTEALISVLDTGSGIEPEHLAHLFHRYWQAKRTRRAGAGLGLAIAKGIVEAHGGRIWAESEVDRGSNFFFTLPLVSLQ
jgi:PAS domain S-box-containing protein